MSKRVWQAVQVILGVVILGLAVHEILNSWDEVRAQPIEWRLQGVPIAASLLVTWVMYGVLIAGWRALLRGWRQRIHPLAAARVWTVSNLGKYIPGKVWAIAGMVVMAERAGVSAAAATGSAILMQLIAIATGTVLALALIGAAALRSVPGGSAGAIVLAGTALLCVVALALPSFARRIGVLVRHPDAVRPVGPAPLARALVANVMAWAGYGLALQLLARGTLQHGALGWGLATGAFAASYLAGFLFPLAPGGLGVREPVLYLLLHDSLGPANALALVAASRLTLTVNELGAAMPFLIPRKRAPGVA